MTDKRYSSAGSAARELASLCAQIRAAHPHIAWSEPKPEAKPPARAEQLAELYRAGMRYAEMGATLGISARTVNSIIAAARKQGTWPADLPPAPGRKKAKQP